MVEPDHPIANIRFSPEEVAAHAGAVGRELLARSPNISRANFEVIGTADLELLFRLYDGEVFGGALRELAGRSPTDSLGFRPSSRMTKAGGATRHTTRKIPGGVTHHYEIVIASDLLFQSFDPGHREVVINGMECANRLEALQRIFEHELIHLAELLIWGGSSCGRPRFRNLARRIFGHTGFTHDLVTRTEKARSELGIQVGSRVSFTFEGETLAGLVNRITKRATVLVESEDGALYGDGKRYEKYYIPLKALRRVGGEA